MFRTLAGGSIRLPVISNIVATIDGSTVTITWDTDIASDSVVEYGPDSGYGSSVGDLVSMVTSHSIELTGLSSGTYHFRVSSKISGGTAVYSDDDTFDVAAYILSDDFTDTDGINLTAHTIDPVQPPSVTNWSAWGTMTINNPGGGVSYAAGGSSGAYYCDVGVADMTVETLMFSVDNIAGRGIAIGCRRVDNNNFIYAAFLKGSPDITFYLYKKVGGTVTQIDSTVLSGDTDLTTPRKVRIVCNGDSVIATLLNTADAGAQVSGTIADLDTATQVVLASSYGSLASASRYDYIRAWAT